MPTVILLDVSLSMSRSLPMLDCNEEYQRRHLAIHGLNALFDHMISNCKLEFTSLIVYSSLWEVIVPFTRDFDNLKASLTKIEEYDKTCLDLALDGIKKLILEEWGTGTPCQIIVITDGSCGIGPHSLKRFVKFVSQPDKSSTSSRPLPFPFPSKLHVICLENSSDQSLFSVVPLYQKLIDVNGGDGQVYVTDGPLSLKSVHQMFIRLADNCYAPFRGILRCGSLSSHIQLSPTPELYYRLRDFDTVRCSVSKDMVICGFLDINDLSSPAAHSRHLVLPIAPPKGEGSEGISKVEAESGDEDGTSDDGKTPSFCVLLHGSLKVEGMVALCHLGEDWYGMLYSWADSKKKSNLMLSIFEPGLDSVVWLGNLSLLAPASEFTVSPYDDDGNSSSPFPIKPAEKRSYAQSCVVWIRQSGLQADIQKILRHARKLPDKTQTFYKELNRLRRAALSFGFYELLDGMAALLERECTLLPGTTHPDAALQLSHAASALSSHQCKDINANIVPLRTKFNETDT